MYSRCPLLPARSKIPRQHPQTLPPTGCLLAINSHQFFFLPNQKLAKQPCNSNCFRGFKPLLYDELDPFDLFLYGFVEKYLMILTQFIVKGIKSRGSFENPAGFFFSPAGFYRLSHGSLILKIVLGFISHGKTTINALCYFQEWDKIPMGIFSL